MQRRVLLATDLSARCDRAFDRAVILAREWRASLTIATALEDWPDDVVCESRPRWRRADRELADAESRIREDLEGTDVDADIIVRRAEAPALLAELAGETAFDLIVTGVARSTGITRAVLGGTVEALLGARMAPVLVVKRRARNAYKRALVGTDFSEASRAALLATSKLFAEIPLTVLYAYRATLALGSLSGSHESADTADWLAQEDCARFVAETLPSELSRTDCAVEAGFPETLLNQYATDNGIDLMSVGTQSRNPLLDIFIGSTCRALILSSPCDLLLSGEEQ